MSADQKPKATGTNNQRPSTNFPKASISFGMGFSSGLFDGDGHVFAPAFRASHIHFLLLYILQYLTFYYKIVIIFSEGDNPSRFLLRPFPVPAGSGHFLFARAYACAFLFFRLGCMREQTL